MRAQLALMWSLWQPRQKEEDTAREPSRKQRSSKDSAADEKPPKQDEASRKPDIGGVSDGGRHSKRQRTELEVCLRLCGLRSKRETSGHRKTVLADGHSDSRHMLPV